MVRVARVQIGGNPRWQRGASCIGALLAAAIAATPSVRGVVISVWPLSVGCLLLAAVQLAELFGPARMGARFRTVIATLRLASALIAGSVWSGNGSYVWNAIAVLIAWHDARTRSSQARPLVPAALALTVAMAWSAYRPGPAGARAMIVAAVAGFVAAITANRTRGE